MNVQFQKIYRDLWLYRLRTGLSIFTICVGLVVFGGIATSLDILTTTYNDVFRQAQPAQIVMTLPAFDEALLRRLNDTNGILSYDARYVTRNVRLATQPDHWISMELHATWDYRAVVHHRIFAEPATFGVVPERGTVWLDRSILRDNNLAIGDTVLVENADGSQHALIISGFVNDVIAFPTTFSDTAVAFVSLDTLQDMQLAIYNRPTQPAFNTLYIRYNVPTGDVLRIRSLTAQLEEEIQSHGYNVMSTTYLTDEPPLKSQTDALNFLLVISSILSFIVTGVLIANFISAIIGSQISEIAIMKSLGAVPSQIIRLFFIMVILIGLIAFALSIPFTGIFASVMSKFLATLIDIDIPQVVVSLDIRLLQFAIAVTLPVVASLLPIAQGAGTTVRDILRSEGTSTNRIIRWVVVGWSSLAPLLLIRLSIRNIFLKPGRFLLTIFALMFPGALFIASFGIEASLKTLDSNLTQSLYNYDIEFVFDGIVPIKQITRLAEKQAGVQYVEAWRQGSMYRIYRALPEGQRPPQPAANTETQPILTDSKVLPPPDGQGSNRPPRRPRFNAQGTPLPPPNRPPNANLAISQAQPSATAEVNPPSQTITSEQSNIAPQGRQSGERSISGDLLIRGVPINSQLIRFTPDQLLNGGWLQDSNDILLTHEAYETISLNVDRSPAFVSGNSTGKEQVWQVSGVTGSLLLSEGYVDINTFEQFIPFYESTIRLAIVTTTDRPDEINQIMENLRQVYNDNGINVNSSFSLNEFITSRADRLNIVTQTLLLLASVIGTVSVIGLISTISINIRERTKSIGILRSLGGNYRHLGTMVVSESLSIVLLSYVLAFLISFPVGNQMTTALADSIYMLDISYQPQAIGAVIWFIIVLVIGLVVAIGPALYAINVTISDTLRYEG